MLTTGMLQVTRIEMGEGGEWFIKYTVSLYLLWLAWLLLRRKLRGMPDRSPAKTGRNWDRPITAYVQGFHDNNHWN